MADGPKYFHGNVFNTEGGDVHFRGDVIVYTPQKQLPRRLTGLPTTGEAPLGRDDALDRLRTALSTARGPVYLTGMGGVGKTTLAAHYVRTHLTEYQHVAWVTQGNDLATSLLASDGGRLVRHLDVELSDDNVADAQHLLAELGRLRGPSLLVIDNYGTERGVRWAEHFPAFPTWQVLLTTREARHRGGTTLDLDNLDEATALTLFQRHYDRRDDDPTDDAATLLDIIRAVGGHALTIELIARTAQARHLPPDRLAALFHERGLQLNRRADDVEIGHDRAGRLEKIFPYLEATFAATDLSPEEEAILILMTILPPTPITLAILIQGLSVDREDDDSWDNFTLALGGLERKGWLRGVGAEAYQLHRVMAEVLRGQFRKREGIGDFLDECYASIGLLLDFRTEERDDPSGLLPHLVFAEGVAELSKAAYPPGLGLTFFLHALTRVQRVFGRYAAAFANQGRAVALFERFLPPEDVKVLSALDLLAQTAGDTEDYALAETLYRDVIGKYETHYGPGEPNLLIARNNLAVLYHNTGQYARAITVLEGLLQDGHLPRLGPAFASSLRNNLAMAYRQTGEAERGAELLAAILPEAVETYGDAHFETQRVRSNLALCYRSLGRLDEGRILLETALRHEISAFGEAHPSVQTRRTNLAFVLHDLGEVNEALRLTRTAVRHSAETLGDDHATTLLYRRMVDDFLAGG